MFLIHCASGRIFNRSKWLATMYSVSGSESNSIFHFEASAIQLTYFSSLLSHLDWNIMSNAQMTNVAKQVPTTIEELSDCELPQNVIKQYGERLVKNINAYIEQGKLQRYIENRPKKKQKTTNVESNSDNQAILLDQSKQKTTNVARVIQVDQSDDEFADDGIDWESAVKMPVTQPNNAVSSAAPAVARPSEKNNPYIQKLATKPVGSKLKSKRSSYF